MQTTLETLGQLERRLNVAVPLEQIDGEVHKRLARLAKTVKIAGFRPGKVPLKMMAQQYGPQVRSDVISDTVQASLNDALREQNLRVAGYPRIEPKEAAAGDQLEFSAVFEVYPEIKLGELSGVTIERPVSEVTPADVDRTIDILRHQNVRYEAAARPAGHGDRAVVDFTGKIDGVAFPGGQAKDFPIVIGEGRMLPEFETALTGMVAGETKTFGLIFPADYHGKEVAGKAAEFTMTVQSVSEPKLPPSRYRIRRQDSASPAAASRSCAPRSRPISRSSSSARSKACSAIRSCVRSNRLRTWSYRDRWSSWKRRRLLERAVADLQSRGVKAEDMQLSVDTFRPQAEERVTYGLIVNEIMRVLPAARPNRSRCWRWSARPRSPTSNRRRWCAGTMRSRSG